MANLSQWDLDNLSPENQKKIAGYQDIWHSNPAQRESVQNAARKIREEAGYFGGMDGSEYHPIEQFKPPTAPTIPGYDSPYKAELEGIIDQVRNPPKYQSDYADLINQSISDIANRPKFEYDAENDAAFQAFKKSALRAGDKAYADNLGGMSAMTGGRPNSWAGTVASQARNQYVLQAEEAVIHFEERAYGRYKDETADMYNLVNLLNSQDQIAYSRFRDTIGDTKDLANLMLQLDDREFEQYKFMADQEWKVFDSEYKAYSDELQFKKDKVSEAMDRVNLQGFVNNKDSIILGVPTGTLSQGARERAEAMQDYIQKTEIDLEKEFKVMEQRHEDDLNMLYEREKIDANIRDEQEQRQYRMMSAEEQTKYRLMSAEEQESYRKANFAYNLESGEGGYTGGDYKGLGSVAAKYESSGDPGTVSSGKGDHGGVSYGIYQFSSNTGGANNFMNFLKSNNKAYYDELNKAGKPGSSGFSAKWKDIAKRDPEGFGQLQQQAIKQQYYDPAVASVKKATGIDVNSRSIALQETIWSTAVQHGSGSVANIVKRALSSNPSGNSDDATLVSAIYDERGAGNGSKYFKSSSKAVQQSVANRFKREKQDALALLNSGGSSSKGVKIPTEVTVTDGNKRDSIVKDYRATITSKEFARLEPQAKRDYISNFADKVIHDYESGALGKNGAWTANEILKEVKESKEYEEYILDYDRIKGHTDYYDQLKNTVYKPLPKKKPNSLVGNSIMTR